MDPVDESTTGVPARAPGVPGSMMVPLEMQWNIHPDLEEGEGFRSSLQIGDRIIFEGPCVDDPRGSYQEALDIWIHCLEWIMVQALPSYPGLSPDEVTVGEQDEEEDEDPALKGYVWVAAWAEDLKEQDEVLLMMGQHQRARGTINRIHRPKVKEESFSPVTFIGGMRDDTIYFIWSCDEKECMGHHYGMSPRSPVWIGTPVTSIPDDMEEIQE